MFLLLWPIAARSRDAVPTAITTPIKALAPRGRPFHECALVDIRLQITRAAPAARAREYPKNLRISR
jgi:hypothetical protein